MVTQAQSVIIAAIIQEGSVRPHRLKKSAFVNPKSVSRDLKYLTDMGILQKEKGSSYKLKDLAATVQKSINEKVENYNQATRIIQKNFEGVFRSGELPFIGIGSIGQNITSYDQMTNELDSMIQKDLKKSICLLLDSGATTELEDKILESIRNASPSEFRVLMRKGLREFKAFMEEHVIRIDGRLIGGPTGGLDQDYIYRMVLVDGNKGFLVMTARGQKKLRLGAIRLDSDGALLAQGFFEYLWLCNDPKAKQET